MIGKTIVVASITKPGNAVITAEDIRQIVLSFSDGNKKNHPVQCIPPNTTAITRAKPNCVQLKLRNGREYLNCDAWNVGTRISPSSGVRRAPVSSSFRYTMGCMRSRIIGLAKAGNKRRKGSRFETFFHRYIGVLAVSSCPVGLSVAYKSALRGQKDPYTMMRLFNACLFTTAAVMSQPTIVFSLIDLRFCFIKGSPIDFTR